MIEESEDGLARIIFDGEGSKEKSRRGYFTNKIVGISRWLEIVRERFKPIF